jgi:hypothetical protein
VQKQVRQLTTVEILGGSALELLLTFLMLFGLTNNVRWVIGPSPISRTIPQIQAELLIVAATVAILISLARTARSSGFAATTVIYFRRIQSMDVRDCLLLTSWSFLRFAGFVMDLSLVFVLATVVYLPALTYGSFRLANEPLGHLVALIGSLIGVATQTANLLKGERPGGSGVFSLFPPLIVLSRVCPKRQALFAGFNKNLCQTWIIP